MKRVKDTTYRYCHCTSNIRTINQREWLRKLSLVLRRSVLATRLELLVLLQKEPHFVSDLISHTNKSQTAISHHLAILNSADLVDKTKNGKFIEYHLTNSGKKLVSAIHSLELN